MSSKLIRGQKDLDSFETVDMNTFDEMDVATNKVGHAAMAIDNKLKRINNYDVTGNKYITVTTTSDGDKSLSLNTTNVVDDLVKPNAGGGVQNIDVLPGEEYILVADQDNGTFLLGLDNRKVINNLVKPNITTEMYETDGASGSDKISTVDDIQYKELIPSFYDGDCMVLLTHYFMASPYIVNKQVSYVLVFRNGATSEVYSGEFLLPYTIENTLSIFLYLPAGSSISMGQRIYYGRDPGETVECEIDYSTAVKFIPISYTDLR